MTEFIKISDTDLEQVDKTKIRNYEDLTAVSNAIASGELSEGDLFTTICRVETISDDIALEVYRIKSYIPEGTSTSNSLVNVDMLTNATADLSGKLDTSAFNAFYNNEYANFVTSTSSDISCRVMCCDFCSYQTDIINPTLQGINSNLNDLGTSINTLSGKVSNLSNCSGLDCIGNVTDTQMADALSCKVDCSDYSTFVSNISSCPGLNATGTVKCITVSGGAVCYPNTSGNLSLCGVFPTMSLSGQTLTICL